MAQNSNSKNLCSAIYGERFDMVFCGCVDRVLDRMVSIYREEFEQNVDLGQGRIPDPQNMMLLHRTTASIT